MWCNTCHKDNHTDERCWKKKKKETSKPKMWCSNCKKDNHTNKTCWSKKKEKTEAKVVQEESTDFTCKIGTQSVNTVLAEEPNLMVDCGATAHIINNKNSFISFDPSFKANHHYLELADGTKSNAAQGRGDATYLLQDAHGVKHQMTLKNALYVPTYPNIFSVKSAVDAGCAVTFQKNNAYLTDPHGNQYPFHQQNRLYFLCNNMSKDDAKKCMSMEKWHKVMGHCNQNDLLKLENVVNGMKITDVKMKDCETCIESKMTETFSTKPRDKSKKALELVHSDLAGPINPTGILGFRYVISFTDDYSGMHFVYFLKQKNDATVALTQFLAESRSYGSIQRLRTDNGTEFTGKAFQKILRENGIKHETSAPYSPHQNGTAERTWRTLFSMARCLLKESNLPQNMWVYAVKTAVFIRNRCYSQSRQQTPYFLMTGEKPNLEKMQTFGSVCYAYEHTPKGKLDARATKGIFVGFSQRSPAYLVYNPESHSVRSYRCVKFILNSESDQTENSETKICLKEDDQNEAVIENDNAELNEPRRSSRVHKPPEYLCDYVTSVGGYDEMIDQCYKVTMGIPLNYEQAMNSAQANSWQIAMDNEMNSLKENDVFLLVPRPEGKPVVGGKWVYNLKEGAQGMKYKARYVAKGYSQVHGVNYDETFSPTVNMSSVRLLMQLAVQYGMSIHQLDMKTAYLNAPIDHEIFVEQPEGYAIENEGISHVWKLQKSLYGLKQSGRNWHSHLKAFLTSIGFAQSKVDPCAFVKHDNGIDTVLLVWVDDILIATNDQETMSNIKSQIGAKFKVTDFGKLSHFLGIQFHFESGVIQMEQSQFIQEVLRRFDMHECKAKSTPCEARLAFNPDAPKFENNRLYREMVGNLMYIMTSTRPDLAFIVNQLSQFLNDPTVEHFAAIKRVFRYLKGSVDQRLSFTKSSNFGICGFSDSDWANACDRKSVGGYCFTLNREKGGVVSWRSKKQACIALSSCEAEYISLCDATKEGLFLMHFLNDLGFMLERFNLFGDNQGSLSLAKNPIKRERSKHIDAKFHFIRDEIEKGSLLVQYVPSDENVADVFTKSVSVVKMKKFSIFLFGEQ